MSSRKRNKTPEDPGANSHAPATDAEAYDLLAAWIRRGPEGARDVERCWSHDNGTVELVLRHEPCEEEGVVRTQARSVTQRTISSAIRSSLGIARFNGAV
jgi:hypothetical protein